MFGKVHIGKHFSDNFPIQNDLKQGDALSPLFFNFALKYAIKKIQEYQVGLKLIGTHQLLEDEMGRACSSNGEKRNACMLLVGKPEGKRPVGRPRCKWVDDIKMDLGELGWGGVDWIGLAQDRDWWRALVNAVMNLWVP
jgi:hypothetical protein